MTKLLRLSWFTIKNIQSTMKGWLSVNTLRFAKWGHTGCKNDWGKVTETRRYTCDMGE